MRVDNRKDNLISVLKEAQDHLGDDGVIDALKNATIAKLGDANTTFVINLVCKTLGVTIHDFKNNKIRDDKRKACICFYVHLMHDKFSLSHEEISKKLPFKLVKRSLVNYYTVIKCARLENPKSYIDKLIANHKPHLEESTDKYILEINKN